MDGVWILVLIVVIILVFFCGGGSFGGIFFWLVLLMCKWGIGIGGWMIGILCLCWGIFGSDFCVFRVLGGGGLGGLFLCLDLFLVCVVIFDLWLGVFILGFLDILVIIFMVLLVCDSERLLIGLSDGDFGFFLVSYGVLVILLSRCIVVGLGGIKCVLLVFCRMLMRLRIWFFL